MKENYINLIEKIKDFFKNGFNTSFILISISTVYLLYKISFMKEIIVEEKYLGVFLVFLMFFLMVFCFINLVYKNIFMERLNKSFWIVFTLSYMICSVLFPTIFIS